MHVFSVRVSPFQKKSMSGEKKLIVNSKGALMHTLPVEDGWDFCLGLYAKTTRGMDLSQELKVLNTLDPKALGIVLVLAFQRRNIKAGAGRLLHTHLQNTCKITNY